MPKNECALPDCREPRHAGEVYCYVHHHLHRLVLYYHKQYKQKSGGCD